MIAVHYVAGMRGPGQNDPLGWILTIWTLVVIVVGLLLTGLRKGR